MKSHIQFITTQTSDTPGTALLLHFDDKRYIFGNVHEGLQRAGLQSGVKFFKGKEIFLTGKTEWRTCGGLLGLLLTVADANNSSAVAKAEVFRAKAKRARQRDKEEAKTGKISKKNSLGSIREESSRLVEEDPTVTLHGGPNLMHLLASARSFIFRKGTPVKVIEHHQEALPRAEDVDWEPNYADHRVQVWAMPIKSSTYEKSSPRSKQASPLKRTLNDFMLGQHPTPEDVAEQRSARPVSGQEIAEEDQQLREFVVSEMFGSKWRYDSLVETPLHEVKMPAQIFIRNSETRRIERYTGPVPNGYIEKDHSSVPNIKVLVREPWPGSLVEKLPPTTRSTTAMSYIIQNVKQRGKFKPDVARALNVPPGPLWAKLGAGEEVQSSDGKTVTPELVLGPAKDGTGFAVIDLPSPAHVQGLLDRPEWKAKRPMTGLKMIIWILGPGVSQDQSLVSFIKSLSELQHIVSSAEHCPNYLAMTSAASAAIRLNQIDSERFPIPIHSNAISPDSCKAAQDSTLNEIPWLPAKRGLKVHLEPSFEVSEKEIIPHLNTALVVQDTPQQVLKLSLAAKSEISQELFEKSEADHHLPGKDAEIICLGTGSALPSLHRNVSATLLRVPGFGSYLFDCGENTLGQLKRVFPEAELAEVLRDLKMIWISHLHADHHLGIASVIKAWHEEVHATATHERSRPDPTQRPLAPVELLEEGKRLFMVAHPQMLRWLDEYSSVENIGYNHLVPLETAGPRESGTSLKWNGVQMGFRKINDVAM